MDIDKEPRATIDDGQEVYRDPSRYEIEKNVRKELKSEFHYIDQIIEEFIHFNHISCIQPNQDDEASNIDIQDSYQRVTPKPFLSFKKSREEMAA